MYNLVQLRSFVETVKNGSLSAAARCLKLTQPAVSQHIRALEARSGKTLLIRKKDGIQPTDAGNVMFRHAQVILVEIAQMDERLNALNGIASGEFKFTTNEILSQTAAVEVITRLCKTAPDLKIKLISTDTVFDVQEEQINLALRIGFPGHGGGIVQRIGDIAGVLVASPDYLKQKGYPSDPSELGALDYLQYREAPDQTELSLIGPDGAAVAAGIAPSFAAYSPSLMLHALKQGLGFAVVPHFAVKDLIAEGKLAQLLEGFTGQPKAIYIVQPETKRNTLANQLVRKTLLEVLTIMPGVQISNRAMHTP